MTTLELFRRPDGRIASRTHLLVLPSVVCANAVARAIADRVAAAVSVSHQHGCAQIGDDATTTSAALEALARHPNALATLVVSLGCETLQGKVLQRRLDALDLSSDIVGIQDEGGSTGAVEQGVEALHRLYTPVSRVPTETPPEVVVAFTAEPELATRALNTLQHAGIDAVGPVDVSHAPVLDIVEASVTAQALALVLVGNRMVPGPALTPLIAVATGSWDTKPDPDDFDLQDPTADELVFLVREVLEGRQTAAERRGDGAFAMRRTLVTL